MIGLIGRGEYNDDVDVGGGETKGGRVGGGVEGGVGVGGEGEGQAVLGSLATPTPLFREGLMTLHPLQLSQR